MGARVISFLKKERNAGKGYVVVVLGADSAIWLEPCSILGVLIS